MASADTYRWTCSCCGKPMTGLPMDIGYREPGGWGELPKEIKARSRLSDDFCLIDHGGGAIDRFIRCILPLPVNGINSEFRFGVWISVSEKSWNVYSDGFDTGVYAQEICFGYLGHNIPLMPDSYLLHVDVEFGSGNERPRVYLHDADHDLVRAQREGVAVQQVEEWAAMMHRPLH